MLWGSRSKFNLGSTKRSSSRFVLISNLLANHRLPAYGWESFMLVLHIQLSGKNVTLELSRYIAPTQKRWLLSAVANLHINLPPENSLFVCRKQSPIWRQLGNSTLPRGSRVTGAWKNANQWAINVAISSSMGCAECEMSLKILLSAKKMYHFHVARI